MTLLLCLADRDDVVLVGDRRLVSNSKMVEDESNKLALLTCQDARLAVGYTGLARQGAFRTSQWLLEALLDSAPPEGLMSPMVERFRICASERWARLRVDNPADKRVTFVLAGFHHAETPPRPYVWAVSNFEGKDATEQPLPADEFSAHFIRETRPSDQAAHIIAAYGIHSPLRTEDLEAMRTLLRGAKPAVALVGKAVEVVRRAADSPRASNGIGKQCNSVALPSDPDQPPVFDYHSATAVTRVHGISRIEARGDEFGSYLLMDPVFEVRDPSGTPHVIAIPRVGRNHLCPCGSGRKYKKCHGSTGHNVRISY